MSDKKTRSMFSLEAAVESSDPCEGEPFELRGLLSRLQSDGRRLSASPETEAEQRRLAVVEGILRSKIKYAYTVYVRP